MCYTRYIRILSKINVEIIADDSRICNSILVDILQCKFMIMKFIACTIFEPFPHFSLGKGKGPMPNVTSLPTYVCPFHPCFFMPLKRIGGPFHLILNAYYLFFPSKASCPGSKPVYSIN